MFSLFFLCRMKSLVLGRFWVKFGKTNTKSWRRREWIKSTEVLKSEVLKSTTMLPPITNFTKLCSSRLKRAQSRNAISCGTPEHCHDGNRGAGAFVGFKGWWSQYFFRSSSPTRLIRGCIVLRWLRNAGVIQVS